MFERIHQKLGTAGFIISIVALVAALSGGAYAASGALNGKQKKEVEKIAKKYSGKPGANGTNGTNGAKGDTGAAGSNGTNGTNGSPGGSGADGKSVEATPIATGEPTACEEQGGVEYEVEGSGNVAEICNGKEGSPWAVGGLPKGATETGAWSFSASEASADSEGKVFVAFSFPVPLSSPIQSGTKVHFTGAFGDSTCTGTAVEPTAPEGSMCIYEAELIGANYLRTADLLGEQPQPDPAGGFLVFGGVEDHAYGRGSFAVTSG
jgi:hypothetical protein